MLGQGASQPGFQFSSVAQSCPTLCDPMRRSTPGLPVHRQDLEGAISRPLSLWSTDGGISGAELVSRLMVLGGHWLFS